MYFLEKFIEDKEIREVIRREVHLVNDLKVNMLIDNDILESKRFFIDDFNSRVIIVSCNDMIILIEIRIFSKNIINKVLHVRSITMISSHSIALIIIHSANLFTNRDFLFEFMNIDVSLYAHIIDVITNAIMTKNEFSRCIKISRNTRLDMIIEIQYLNAFLADSDEMKNYAERKSTRTHKIF